MNKRTLIDVDYSDVGLMVTALYEYIDGHTCGVDTDVMIDSRCECERVHALIIKIERSK